MADMTTSNDLLEQETHAPMLNRVIAADPLAVRQVLIELADRLRPALEPEELAHLELALAEILNNIVEHAYVGTDQGLIHLSVVCSEKVLSCAVADDGASLPAECLAPRALPGAGDGDVKTMALPEGGFGWVLIQGLCQDLCYYRENDRNFLAFAMPLHLHASHKDTPQDVPKAPRKHRR